MFDKKTQIMIIEKYENANLCNLFLPCYNKQVTEGNDVIYLIAAILSSSLVSVVMRLSKTRIKNENSLLAVNYLICAVVAGGYMGLGNALPQGAGNAAAVMGIGTVTGAMYLLGFLLFQWNVGKNGVVLSSTFMKLGVLISIGVSILIFGEKPGIAQALGIVLAVGAIVVINGKGEGAAASRGGLVLLLLLGGMADAMSKFFEEWGDPREESWFLLLTFLVALLLCLVLVLKKKQRLGKWELIFGLMIGIPNYFSSLLFLKALESVRAVIAYPVYSVGGILAVTAVGLLLFRERLQKHRWLALAVILTALVLLNVG